MAGKNKNEIFVPSRIDLYLSSLTGLVEPTDPTATPPAPWEHAGYSTKDSLQFETSPEFEDVESAQTDYPVLKLHTKEAASLQIDLQQWSRLTFQSAFGGGTFTEETAGVYKFSPPQIGEREEVAVLVHAQQGTKHYMFVFLRTQQVEGVSTSLNKGAVSTLPLRVDVLGSDVTGLPWYLLTNDPAFAPAA